MLIEFFDEVTRFKAFCKEGNYIDSEIYLYVSRSLKSVVGK